MKLIYIKILFWINTIVEIGSMILYPLVITNLNPYMRFYPQIFAGLLCLFFIQLRFQFRFQRYLMDQKYELERIKFGGFPI